MSKEKSNKILNSFEDLAKEMGLTESVMENPKEKNQNSINEMNTEHSISIPTGVKKEVSSRDEIDMVARAPYNFIPIDNKVLRSDFSNETIPFDEYHEDQKTGYLDLEIETESPIFIRGMLTREQRIELDNLEKEIEKLKDNRNQFAQMVQKQIARLNLISGFFKDANGDLRIPGSSVRGLVRTLVEIITYGKFGFTEMDRKFHYRSFLDASIDMRRMFVDSILTEESDSTKRTGYTQNVKAGYLSGTPKKPRIIPCDYTANNVWFYRVEESDVRSKRILSEDMSFVSNGRRKPSKRYKIGYKKIKFIPSVPKVQSGHSTNLYYAKVTQVFNPNDSSAPSTALEGYLVHSGWMPGRRSGKHLHWILGPESKLDPLDFVEGVVKDYGSDRNRQGGDLLERLAKDPEHKVPCFYITETVVENGKVVEKVKSFGHTGIFRLAYEKKLQEFFPEQHINDNVLDFASAMFGVTGDSKTGNQFAGRVFFEDAILKGTVDDLPEGYPEILTSPKPTTFQHYLVQTELDGPHYKANGKFDGFKGYNDYNSEGISIRGNKLYWHKKYKELDSSQTFEGSEEKKKKILNYTKISPVKSTKFIGRIRFENLSVVELGALLFALNLPEGCAHKIGMGKPLGLGSIRITPTLHLSDRKERYKDLFSKFSEDLVESIDSGFNIKHFKNEFAKHILTNLLIAVNYPNDCENELWGIERMKQLKKMLTLKTGISPNSIKYMELPEFKERRVLPKPTDVK